MKNKSLLLILSILVIAGCGSETTSNTPITPTSTITPTTSLIYEETPSKYDDEYHYYKCLNDDDSPEKKEAHSKEILPMIEPTETSVGNTEITKCSKCDYIYDEGKELPKLDDVNYDLNVETKYVDGVGVCDTVVYTLKLSKQYN